MWFMSQLNTSPNGLAVDLMKKSETRNTSKKPFMNLVFFPQTVTNNAIRIITGIHESTV